MEKSQRRSPGHTGFDPKPKTARQAIKQLVLANRILSNEGIFDYLGHVSVRNPENRDTFFIARAVAPETVTYEDILEADLEGNVLTQTVHKPYSERIIHGAILKARPDVNAVVHARPHSDSDAFGHRSSLPAAHAYGHNILRRSTRV